MPAVRNGEPSTGHQNQWKDPVQETLNQQSVGFVEHKGNAGVKTNF